MATYKQPCVHCGEFVERDVSQCPKCGINNPFGYRCPSCLNEIEKGESACSRCGRSLYVTCLSCGKRTFVDEKCGECGASLVVRCPNPRCGHLQFFENVKCTACGKKIKNNMEGR